MARRSDRWRSNVPGEAGLAAAAVLSAAQGLFQQVQVLVQVGVVGAFGRDLAHGVQYRGVIAPAKHFADFRQAFLRHLLGQIHGNLAWLGNVGRALLAVHVGHLDLVEIGHRFLDVFDADLAVLFIVSHFWSARS